MNEWLATFGCLLVNRFVLDFYYGMYRNSYMSCKSIQEGWHLADKRIDPMDT